MEDIKIRIKNEFHDEGRELVVYNSLEDKEYLIITNGAKVYIITPEPPPVGEWLHIALTMDGMGEWATYFFNGEMVVEGTMVFGTNRETTFHFGCGVMDGGAAFSGVIDEIRFYERILTDDEITALYMFDPSSSVEEQDLPVDNRKN